MFTLYKFILKGCMLPLEQSTIIDRWEIRVSGPYKSRLHA